MSKVWVRSAITAAAVCAILGHIIFPNLKIDSVILALLILAVLPWLAALIESAEFPGGWKIKLRDIRVATAQVAEIEKGEQNEGANIKKEGYLSLIEKDPNLALATLRIEIERKLKALIAKHRFPEQTSLAAMIDVLARNNLLAGRCTISGLKELVAVGNRAVHGARVDNKVASWAFENADGYLRFLDRQINA